MKIAYGTTTARDRGAITNHESEWSEIVELFRNPVRNKITTEQYEALTPEKRQRYKNTGLFFGGRCKGGQRKDETVESRTIVNLDIDDNGDWIRDELMLFGEITQFSGMQYLVHSTRSHSPDKAKYRILIPLSREVSPAEYVPVALAIAERLDSTMRSAAAESFTVAQGMYFPSVSSDQEYEFFSIDGSPFDPDEALAKYKATDDSNWPRLPKKKLSVFTPGRRIVHPEEKRTTAPIITAVHRAIGPFGMLDDVLSHIYQPAGDRYFPIGATGAASVRVYDDAFIQSDHASDPANGQHNCFDLARIHLFGNLDKDHDLSELTPSDWPSYKAMVEWALAREDVRTIYEQIVEENEAQSKQAMLDLLDDFISADEEDDLIGEKQKEKPTIEAVLKKVSRVISEAKSLNDLEKRIEAIRGMPVDEFKDLHRNIATKDIQAKFKEFGQSLTKAEARKLLKPTVSDLCNQLSDRPMPEWLKDWCYIVSENKFMNIETKEVLTRDGFNGKFNKAISRELGSTEMGLTIVTAFDAATQVYQIPAPYAARYRPLKPAIFEEDGSQFVNTYKPPVVESSSYKGDEGVKLLKRLVRDLFPDERNQSLLLDFFAHCVRFPGKKLRYALLVKGSEEEGKSLFVALMRRLLGRSNTKIVGANLLVEKFNSWANETVFCAVEEVKIVGKEAYEVLNNIKPVITNDEISVRRMQKDQTTEFNFTNLYLTTNFNDCLPMQEDNTRFLVLFTQFHTNDMVKAWREERVKKEGFDYVKRLYEHVKEHPQQFVKFFDKYKFSEYYDPDSRAPWTEFKQVMAEEAKSDEAHLLEKLIADKIDPTISEEVLIWESVKEHFYLKGIGDRIRGRGVATFLKPLGFVNARTTTARIGGKTEKIRVWTKDTSLLNRNGNLTHAGLEKAIRAICEKSELDEPEILAANVVAMRR